MSTDPNPAMDGSNTELHRRIASLERMRESRDRSEETRIESDRRAFVMQHERDEYFADKEQAERERDAALARVKESDAIVSNQLRKLAEQHDQLKAAESALASARTALREQLEKTGMPDADGEGPSNQTVETWGALVEFVAELVYDADSCLNKTPSPAPCSGCATATELIRRASRDMETQHTMLLSDMEDWLMEHH